MPLCSRSTISELELCPDSRLPARLLNPVRPVACPARAASITAVTDADPTTAGNQAGWQVNAGANGTDLLNGVEKVSDNAGHNFLLVGNGGYATIQAAIDAVHTAGGGTVVVPSGGVFRSGSLVLRSHVELHLERGATLRCSGDWAAIASIVIVLGALILRRKVPTNE